MQQSASIGELGERLKSFASLARFYEVNKVKVAGRFAQKSAALSLESKQLYYCRLFKVRRVAQILHY